MVQGQKKIQLFLSHAAMSNYAARRNIINSLSLFFTFSPQPRENGRPKCWRGGVGGCVGPYWLGEDRAPGLRRTVRWPESSISTLFFLLLLQIVLPFSPHYPILAHLSLSLSLPSLERPPFLGEGGGREEKVSLNGGELLVKDEIFLFRLFTFTRSNSHSQKLLCLFFFALEQKKASREDALPSTFPHTFPLPSPPTKATLLWGQKIYYPAHEYPCLVRARRAQVRLDIRQRRSSNFSPPLPAPGPPPTGLKTLCIECEASDSERERSGVREKSTKINQFPRKRVRKVWWLCPGGGGKSGKIPVC